MATSRRPSRRQPLGTSAVSVASGYSVQQIRDLEARGVIPPAARAPNGYRQFSDAHVRALRAYRNVALAIGPVRARRAFREVRALPADRAVALVNSFHVALARERDDALAAQQALRLIRAESVHEAEPTADDAMTITELAGALGVRTSTLRFWEKAGLVVPERVSSRAGAARRYPLPAIREARIAAALRAAGYRIPDVQQSMRAIRELEGMDEPRKALQSRVDAIARRSLAMLRAGSDLADIITTREATSPDTQASMRSASSS